MIEKDIRRLLNIIQEKGADTTPKQLNEGTGATDYNPKSQGGTRKELLAKYHKTKDSKDAEAARKAGATQQELKQAIKEGDNIGGERYNKIADLKGRSVDKLNKLIQKLEVVAKYPDHTQTNEYLGLAKMIRAEKIGKKPGSEQGVAEDLNEISQDTAISYAGKRMNTDTIGKSPEKIEKMIKGLKGAVARAHGEKPTSPSKKKEEGVAEGSLKEADNHAVVDVTGNQFHAKVRLIMQSLVRNYQDYAQASTSIPSAPDTTKFRAQLGGMIEYASNLTVPGGYYSHDKQYIDFIQIGGGLPPQVTQNLMRDFAAYMKKMFDITIAPGLRVKTTDGYIFFFPEPETGTGWGGFGFTVSKPKTQGVAAGSEIKIPTEDGITMQDIRLMAGEGPLTKKTILQAIAVIRKQRKPQGVAEGRETKWEVTYSVEMKSYDERPSEDRDYDETVTAPSKEQAIAKVKKTAKRGAYNFTARQIKQSTAS
jgi:hypothetical protein